MFKQPNNDWQHGFDLTFVNGWEISVKWGMEAGADPDRWLTTPDDEILVYKTAEVAAFNDDDWWDFKNKMAIPDEEPGRPTLEALVQRNVGSDQVADMIIVIKNLYLDEYSRWKNGIQLGAYDRTRPPEPADGFASVDLRHEIGLKSSP